MRTFLGLSMPFPPQPDGKISEVFVQQSRTVVQIVAGANATNTAGHQPHAGNCFCERGSMGKRKFHSGHKGEQNRCDQRGQHSYVIPGSPSGDIRCSRVLLLPASSRASDAAKKASD